MPNVTYGPQSHIYLLYVLWWVWNKVIELNWIELNWIELNWIELNWIELNWIELNWIELNWIELNWIELNTMHYFGMGHILEQIRIPVAKINDKLTFLHRICGKSITALLDY